MKIRQGFVSNSSSSSFICFGLKVLKRDIEEMYEMIDDSGYYIHSDSEMGYSDPDFTVIGETYEGNDYGMPKLEYNILKLKEIADEISTKTGLKGEPVIITGTKMS